ncbi:MAG: 30S ribosomal protein S2 [Pseudomonadota bacterium]
MANVTIREMLEAGTHFGHITQRWNPKMKPYIFGSRNGIHILDLRKSAKLFRNALDFVVDTVSSGNKVLFVGTKKQFSETIQEEVAKCNMNFVTHRWLGGMLTNFSTIRNSINRMQTMEKQLADGVADRLKKKEVLKMNREVDKLKRVLSGIEDMKALPGAIIIVDPNKEKIAIAEARKLSIPVIALTDTNCDPDVIDFIVPGNDDAIRSIRLFISKITEACNDGSKVFEKKIRGQKQARPEKKKKVEESHEKEPQIVAKRKAEDKKVIEEQTDPLNQSTDEKNEE